MSFSFSRMQGEREEGRKVEGEGREGGGGQEAEAGRKKADIFRENKDLKPPEAASCLLISA